jgi:8-amino-7-oxononanoate synthase
MRKSAASTTSAQSLEAFAATRLASLEAAGLRRSLNPTRRNGVAASRGGRELISFCDNDYLGLSHDPRVIAAAADAARLHGAGAGASRLVSGDVPLNRAIEARLARMKGLPAARLFGSGYLANVGVIPVLVGGDDLIVMDALAHACLHAGARLSGATVRLFAHNAIADAGRLLQDRASFGRALVITETVFSMDGDLAPLAALSRLCEIHDAWLMTDDAHGFGVVDIDNPAPVQMGTLSKAVGVYGGYVAGGAALVDLMASRARSFVYTTGLPPPVLGAIDAALSIIETEPERGQRSLAHARLFGALMGLGPVESAIVPIIIGEADAAMSVAAALEQQGMLVTAIRPPTVPPGTARLRVTFSASHSETDIRRLAAMLHDLPPRRSVR